MRTSLPRSLVLGGAIATSLCIGYALGAQPHMDEAITILQSARAERRSRTRAAIARRRSG